MAEQIPNAELIELPGHDHAFFFEPEDVLAEVRRFLREVLVPSTVKDRVAGSGLEIADRGTHELKGVGEWRLYAVEPAS